ncbi:unnamed protein product [Leptidea sinapis]|uniref:RNA-binding region-containing protein 3 n=1 Tax=Leptidea sinapis TaxID=189913 RepID=A0A5E4QGN0_9NEOP|nr:unnamed protein product [Leptidea sinapis]
MSKILIIRHLPQNLSFQDKQQLLKHFGADKVWETNKKRNYIFASFSTLEKAKSSLQRLHQLEIAKRRLVVEYSFERQPSSEKDQEQVKETSSTTNKVKDFLQILNAWNPSVNFYQPPLPYLKYKYPNIDTKIAVNIIYSLFHHEPFYIQTLHLMNKMSLKEPFSENIEASIFFKDTFRPMFIDEIAVPPPVVSSDIESEIESCDESVKQKTIVKIKKRKHTLPVTRKRPAAILATANIPAAKKVHLNQEVFDITPVAEPKKISLVVHQNALVKPCEEPEIIGELGKFAKEEKPVEHNIETIEPDKPTISKRELLQNRISHSDMKILPVFRHYHPGQPSLRLYIKNLAKSVTEQDVKRIFKRYIEHLPEEEQNGFDVRVMQEGRMKGQAFVTFPTLKLAENALNESNGYLLKDKPMVVQFARAANKKSVD